jgi:hypothetical protein
MAIQPFNTDYDTLPGFVPTADLSAVGNQYKIVKLLSTAGQIGLAATSVLVQGFVLMNRPGAGEPAELACGKVVKVIAGTSVITPGLALGVNTTSQVVNTTTDNRFIIGKAITPSTAIGDIISMLIIPGGARY